MYGVEIWGCSRHLEPIEQVQLRALWMFFGVGTLHRKASLLREVEALPVVWEAKMRCVKFWLKVLNNEMYEGRLEERPKLGMMKEIASLELESSCVENDDQAQRGHDSIPDRGGKLARSGEEGENMQGLPEWRRWRRLPLAVTVPGLGSSQATLGGGSQPVWRLSRTESHQAGGLCFGYSMHKLYSSQLSLLNVVCKI